MINSGWYAHGGIVLDRLLGVARAREVRVSTDQMMVSPLEIRKALDLSRAQVVSIEDRPVHVVCNVDQIHLAPSNQLVGGAIDTLRGRVRLELIDYDLTTADIIRLDRWTLTYPELEVDALLAQRLGADMSHIRKLSDEFEDVALLLKATETEFAANRS